MFINSHCRLTSTLCLQVESGLQFDLDKFKGQKFQTSNRKHCILTSKARFTSKLCELTAEMNYANRMTEINYANEQLR